MKENCEYITFKERLVAMDQASDRSVTKTENFGTLLTVTKMKGYKTRFFDTETAFLNA